MIDLSYKFRRPEALVVELLSVDLSVANAALVAGDTLESAIIMSLFTDRRANVDDDIPDGGGRRGWFGDTFPPVENDRIGSRLWLLSREKSTTQTLNRARDYCYEALQWLIDDGVCDALTVDVEFQGDLKHILAIQITTDGPSGPNEFRFDHIWKDVL